MKIRTDFVTNSSSSSFILARKDSLTENQKQVIIDFVENKMLGTKILEPTSPEEDIKKAFDNGDVSDYYEKEIRDALNHGKSIYSGSVNFECCEYDVAELFQELWLMLEKADDENFDRINTSLDY